MEKKAAAVGIYNRKTGAAFAAEKIIASGNYTPEQQSRIRKAAARYGAGYKAVDMTGPDAGGDYSEQYNLIDSELKKRGMGVLARQESKDFWQRLNYGKYYFAEDTSVTATQTEEEKRAAAEKLRQEKERRKKEAEERKRNMLQSKIDAQVQGLTAPAAPAAPAAPSAPAAPVTPEKTAFIQAELDKAAKAAEEVGIALSARQRDQVTDAAGARYDQIHSEKQAKLDSEIKALEEKYRLQQMINQGKGKEVAIEEALNRARKQAETLGTSLTAEQEQRIRTVTAASYDLSHKNNTAGITSLAQASRINVGVLTNNLTSRGGFQSGAALTSAARYNREILQTEKNTLSTLTQIKNLCEKMGTF